jgi:hypothetical protein
MSIIRNLFAIIGLIVVILIIVGITRYGDMITMVSKFDPDAGKTYLELAQKLAETGDAAEATIWRQKVIEGMSPDDVEQVMKSVASEYNIKNVGELPLYREIEAMSGKPYRYAKIFMFCDAMTASRMMDYSDSYSAYLPCRVSLIEDKKGDLWIYTLNMDLMIHGGKALPPALKEEALHVKKIMTDIMNRGATGAF